MSLDDAPTDGEAHTQAVFLGGYKRVEKTGADFFSNAVPKITDTDVDTVFIF